MLNVNLANLNVDMLYTCYRKNYIIFQYFITSILWNAVTPLFVIPIQENYTHGQQGD